MGRWEDEKVGAGRLLPASRCWLEAGKPQTVDFTLELYYPPIENPQPELPALATPPMPHLLHRPYKSYTESLLKSRSPYIS